jgi:hypothetical protein
MVTERTYTCASSEWEERRTKSRNDAKTEVLVEVIRV